MNDEGRLPRNFELLHEETAPNEIKFIAGAKDGIGVFHMSPKKPEQVVEKILNFIKSGRMEKIAPVIRMYSVLQIIDPLLAVIRENAVKVDLASVGAYAESLAFESDDEELVKLGIALLGLFDWSDSPEMQNKIVTLGLYEEFTLYAVVAAGGWDNGNDVIFQIVQKVDGWGKIHAVERLKPETDEIREWILRDGCSNAVMDAYLGLECANKGDLIGVLLRDSLDVGLFESIGIIIDALLDEGPVEGISAYEHAEEALLRYLQFAKTYAFSLKHLWRVLNVGLFLDGDELSNKEELLRLCAEISGRPAWREQIMSTLSDPDNEDFFYADNTASRLNIDVTDLIYQAIKKDPIKNVGYMSQVFRNADYARELTALYEKVLPLDEMAAGMGDYLFSPSLNQEYNCLDSILQELKAYPLVGERLVRTGLQSPVTRNRNFACSVLEEWSKTLGRSASSFSPDLYAALRGVAAVEVNAYTKKTMTNLIKWDK
jgi:hypothetical protein